MGYGDPDHQHPLTLQREDIDNKVGDVTCFRCELPFDPRRWYYGCTDCNHFVYKVCFELPHNMKHPLHPQHPLTLFPSPISLTDCSICHDPCLGRYTFQCQTCLTFSLHLKCFITIHLKEKHRHILTLYELDDEYRVMFFSCRRCRTCGFPFDDIDSYIFHCQECWFFIHFECAFLPSKVKRHHAHELTFEYNYPKESDLSYCDVCEDKYDKEPIDRSLSYYYCKICDYIAHVHCVTKKPDRDTTQFENFVHEHPMIYSRKPKYRSAECACECKKRFSDNESFYFCSKCDYKLHKSCAEFPRLIKHPHHKDHTLSLGSCTSLNTEAELSVCGFCSKNMENGSILVCIDCDYAEHLSCAMWFTHPHHEGNLLLRAGDDRKFRCDACGELGHGYRMSYSNFEIQYDLHLECFALPGKIECCSHSHPLFLIAPPTKIRPDFSTTFLCKICHTEAGPNFWMYCCKQCNFVAHLKCTIGGFLSNVGSSNNLSSLISIAQCEKEQFMVTKPDRSICSKLKCGHPLSSFCDYPVFTPIGLFISPKLPLGDDSDQQILSSVTDLDEPFVDILHCPKCERPISSQAYSSFTDWVNCNIKANNQTSLQQEPLTQLDEELVDKLYCPICNQLIFAPTYSCVECQIYFHKSCAVLPRKFTDNPRHMFVLVSPSMLTVMLKSKCSVCMDPIQGYAYVCRRCEIAVDVVCAIGSPLLKLENQKHSFFSKRWAVYDDVTLYPTPEAYDCKACGNPFAEGSVFVKCGSYDCRFVLHFECALLPYTKLHRIHREHGPLVLEHCLNLSVDDYICDVCEKELNPCLWAYRCSNSCGDRATSHVSCIVTSNKRCHFDYSKECSYPNKDQLRSHVNYVKEKMTVSDLVTALANAIPDKRVDLLYDNLSLLVDEIEHDHAVIITIMLIKMDQTDVLHWIESPNALKAKIDDVMETFRIACAPPNNDDDDDENLTNMRSLILELSSRYCN